jgi:diacylglycerol kinase (ATP)
MSAPFDIRGVRSTFIFNPRSGHNVRNPHLLEHTRRFIAQHQLDATLEPTTHPQHATALAAAAVSRGVQLVVSIGGDGTLNEVASALVNTSCTLGIIPCGSGNGLGRHLGIPKPIPHAYHTLLAGDARAIDYGEANGHPFFNVAGLGFDAEISSRFNHLTRRGFRAYIGTTFRTLRDYRPSTYKIHHEGGCITTSAFLIAVANSDQYGNNCYIAPGATVNDGQLNITVIERIGLLNALPLGVRLLRGSIGSSRGVQRLTGTNFCIERTSPAPIHTDGEVHQTDATVEVKIHPGALKILTPVSS